MNFKGIAWLMGPAVADSVEINIAAPAITPTLGSDLLINGNFEAISTWSNYNTPTTSQQDNTVAHGGTYSWHIITDAATEGIQQTIPTLTVGEFYQQSCWNYLNAALSIYIEATSSQTAIGTATAGSWVNLLAVFRATATSHAFRVNSGGATARNWNTDDYTVKQLTFSTCRTLLGTRSQLNGTYTCKPTVAIGTQAGLLIGYQDDNNFLMMIIDRRLNRNADTAKLIRKTGGTWAADVITGNITYSAGAILKTIINGTTVQLFYNGVQVGTDQTIADMSPFEKAVYGFSTYATNTVGQVITSPAVT